MRGTGGAPVSIHPYVGILGVFLGAMTATLNGRILTSGLPDLRGAFGFGFDEASWIPTALNMGTIGIGVFSVFLGAAYGVRRVLMISGAAFTLISLALPFSPNLGTMLALQALAGISSGSFYSLTLTFVARNLPPKLVVFGIAAYALDIVVTSNIAALVQGMLVEYLSWRWMFWTIAALTPAVMVCLYFGVPPAPSGGERGPRPNWRGFLYMSLGLSLIYGAFDQGERLEWFHSGTIVGLFAGGGVLIAAALVRRYYQPNPYLNLPFLNARNIVILGLGIFMIRFALLAPLFTIPAFLGNIQQYRALQTGQALAWVAAPQFALVWLGAIASVFIQPRIVMAAGFTAVAAACWMAAQVDASWAGHSFLRTELALAAGIAAAFVGLVVNLVVMAIEMGAMAKVADAATFSASMHTMRLLGGEVGAVLLARFLTVREHFHSNLLGQNVTAGNWLTGERLGALSAAVASSAGGPDEMQARSLALLSSQVRSQAYTLAVADAFRLIAFAIVAYLLLLLLLRRSTINLRQLGKTK